MTTKTEETKTEETKTEDLNEEYDKLCKMVEETYEHQKQIQKMLDEQEQEREYRKEPMSVYIRFCKNGPEKMYFQNALLNNFTLGIDDPSTWSFNPKDMRDIKNNCNPYPFSEHYFD